MKIETQENFTKTALRLPPELHAELKEAAIINGRSLNAEILDRLRTASGIAAKLNEMSKQQKELYAIAKDTRDKVNLLSR